MCGLTLVRVLSSEDAFRNICTSLVALSSATFSEHSAACSVMPMTLDQGMGMSYMYSGSFASIIASAIVRQISMGGGKVKMRRI